MNLLIDIGNTRIKWATDDADQLVAHGAVSHADWNAQSVDMHVLESIPQPQRVLVANVGGARIADAVRNAVVTRWGAAPEFIVSTAAACGVRNAYPVPGNLGVDRWLGLIAVHAMRPELACIVGVGTAMTVDCIDAAGQHLGGVIVPGPELMVSSLLRSTSDIAQRAASGEVTAELFADNTLGAIRQGAVHALAALAERAMDTLRRTHSSDPVLVLTGGAAAAIQPLLSSPAVSIADLVLKGLAHYATTAR
jgi:type III pantothenate kinase